MTLQVCCCTYLWLFKKQKKYNYSLFTSSLSFCVQDLLLGEQPEEVVVNYCEAKDKFMADWCPETSPELEAMARAEENKILDRDFLEAPAIWIISTDPQGTKTGPRVVFGNRT